MRTKTKLLPLLFLLLVLALAGGAGAQSDAPHGSTSQDEVIGDGTAASCQTEDAANAFAAAVAAGGVISFDCGPAPVVIEVNTNVTDQQVTVNGGGLINLSGEDLRQIFYVTGSGDLTLNDIILQDGASAQGGAIYAEAQATVTLRRSFVTSNNASGEGGGVYNLGTLNVEDTTFGSNITQLHGGGIFNNGGTVTITDSYLISNQAPNGSGGAVYTVGGQVTVNRSAVRSSFIGNQGGGIFAAGPTGITNSTFSNNRALQGGALFAVADVSILNATFNENRADTAGAIWRAASSNTTIKNSIVAGSLDTDGNAPSLNCDGPPLISLGRNIVDDNTCVSGSPGDLLATDPQLGVWYGSPLRAYIPAATSPALDYALDCPPVDQRGYPRPLGAGCDSGSIERGDVVYLPFFVR